MYINANFSNVISIFIGYRNENYYSAGLNFRLDTGEQIAFESLFTNSAYIKTILTQSIYEELAWSYLRDKESVPDASTKDYSIIEKEAYELMNIYLKNPNVNFSFSPSDIEVFLEGKNYISIEMEKFADYIAIYNPDIKARTLRSSFFLS